MKNCPKCGAFNSSYDTSCMRCGASLTITEVSTSSASSENANVPIPTTVKKCREQK